MTNVNINPEKPLRGRRLSWAEFTRQTGRQRPDYAAANDNIKVGAKFIANIPHATYVDQTEEEYATFRLHHPRRDR